MNVRFLQMNVNSKVEKIVTIRLNEKEARVLEDYLDETRCYEIEDNMVDSYDEAVKIANFIAELSAGLKKAGR